MKYALFIVLSVFLTLLGCVSYQRCADKYQWKSDTTISVTYKDTVIAFSIKGSAPVFASAPIGTLVSAHSGTAHASASVIHDTINLEVSSSDSTYRIRLDSALKVITTNNKQMAVVTEKAKLDKILKWISGCLSVVFLIVLVPRIFKKK